MSTASTGRRPEGGRPTTVRELVAMLEWLEDPSVGRVARIAACPVLIEACKGVIARRRGALMVEATTGRGRVSQKELAAQLGVHPNTVNDAIREYLNAPEEAGRDRTEA